MHYPHGTRFYTTILLLTKLLNEQTLQNTACVFSSQISLGDLSIFYLFIILFVLSLAQLIVQFRFIWRKNEEKRIARCEVLW